MKSEKWEIPLFSLNRDEMKQVKERISEAITPIAKKYGQEVVGLEMTGNAKGRLIKVAVGSKEGPGIKELTGITREFNNLIDSSNGSIIDFDYQLEVSSPGIDRNLETINDFNWNLGRELKVTFRSVDKNEKVKGILSGVTDDKIILILDNEPKEINMKDITKAKIVIKF